MRGEWIAVLGALLALLFGNEAQAYPWMIQHQYTTCSQCHVDPSGGSALTDYGRAQTEAILRSTYGKPVEEPGKVKDFLFGAVELPDALILQGDVRGMFIPQPGNFRFILMQSDLRGAIKTEDVTVYASAGIVNEGANGARVFAVEPGNDPAVIPVVRDYWVGWTPSRSLTIRGGRMALPFGIRSDDHIRYTRAVTRTSTNADQQLGLAAAFETRETRGEVMGVVGNVQVRPDAFRERGYAAYATWAPINKVELGVSSLVLGSQLDIESLLRTTRQSHGLFTRVAPVEKLALLVEGDLLFTGTGSAISRTNEAGAVLDAQLDWEAARGVHLKAGGEYCDLAFGDGGAAGRGWGALQWFFAPHVNLRIDMMYGPLRCTALPNPDDTRFMGLAQIHAFL